MTKNTRSYCGAFAEPDDGPPVRMPAFQNAHIERKKSKCDYLLAECPTEAQVADIEVRINALIESSLPVTVEFMSKEEAASYQKKPLTRRPVMRPVRTSVEGRILRQKAENLSERTAKLEKKFKKVEVKAEKSELKPHGQN